MEQHFSHNRSHSHSNECDYLYHKEVYFPENLRKIAVYFLQNLKDHRVYIPKHVMDEIKNKLDGESHDFSQDDIYGAIHKILYAAKAEIPLNIFEMGWNNVADNKIKLNKVVIRTSLDSDLDISLVFLKTGPDTAKIKTAWINRKDDQHKEGFNTSRYVQDPNKKSEPKEPTTPKKKVVVVRKKHLDNKDFNNIYKSSN